MARTVGFKEVLATYENAAIQLGTTLTLQQQNTARLRDNVQERRRDLRRWRTAKSRKEHSFFLNGNKRRHEQILYEGMKLEALIGHLRHELHETRSELETLEADASSSFERRH